ncbi:MAG: alpha/beta fold hydrolase [Sphingobium sp.]|nr:alpha/beta fold hydrolase [Sphingobium sp.]
MLHAAEEDQLTDRRNVLKGLAGLAVAGTSCSAWASPNIDASQDYPGVYSSNGRAFGISRFINDGGERVLLFTDYSSGKVRTLFPQRDGKLVMGPGFSTPSPVEFTLSFDRWGSMRIEDPAGKAESAVRIATRDVPISFKRGGALLAGTLILPPGPGPHPAVVLLHGSGPLTRDSFGPYPRFFSSLGLAVLIYDKRGTGGSTGVRLDASTGRPAILSPSFYPEDLRADAIAAVKALQGRADIDARHIGLWGSSEGGMLTTQAAAHFPDIAFVINSSGFMGTLADTILYQGVAKMRAANKTENEIAQAVAFNRQWMESGRSGRGFAEFALHREKVIAAGKLDWLFYEDAGFTSQEQLTWAMRHILDFDSLPDAGRVKCPALGLFGEKDVLTDSPRASANMLHAMKEGGNSDVTVKVIPNAGHSLMEASDRGYMAEGVFDTLRAWLSKRV